MDTQLAFSSLVGIEDRLAANLVQTARHVTHADTLDDEQRSEIYAILHALESDSRQHRAIVGQWVSDRPAPSAA
jgi:hypothetical protein